MHCVDCGLELLIYYTFLHFLCRLAMSSRWPRRIKESVGTPSKQNCVVRGLLQVRNGETEICNLRYLKILKGQVQWWIGSNADTSICGCGFSHLAQQETVVASAVSAF